MSVALTELAVWSRTKTVTRRAGWWTDRNGRRLLLPGQKLTLCRKVMGRKPDEPLVRIVEVDVVDVRREPLDSIDAEDVAREGFAHLTPAQFVAFYIDHMGGKANQEITRIEWEYPVEEWEQ